MGSSRAVSSEESSINFPMFVEILVRSLSDPRSQASRPRVRILYYSIGKSPIVHAPRLNYCSQIYIRFSRTGGALSILLYHTGSYYLRPSTDKRAGSVPYDLRRGVSVDSTKRPSLPAYRKSSSLAKYSGLAYSSELISELCVPCPPRRPPASSIEN